MVENNSKPIMTKQYIFGTNFMLKTIALKCKSKKFKYISITVHDDNLEWAEVHIETNV